MPLRVFSVDKAAPASSLAARASAIAKSAVGRSASPRSQRSAQAAYAAPSGTNEAHDEAPEDLSGSGGDSSDEADDDDDNDEDDDEDENATAAVAARTLATALASSQLASPADVDSWVPRPNEPPAAPWTTRAAMDGAYLGDALVGATVSVLDMQGQRTHAKVILYAGRGER